MAKDQRTAVVSVRLTDEEQSQLRHAAEVKGTSLSDYVRSVVVREVATSSDTADRPCVEIAPTTTSSTSATSRVGEGFFWQTDDPTQIVSPSTVIVSRS